MSKKDFVHLHLHSDFSLLESAIQIKPLTKKLADLNMKSAALTDFGNMFGAISFYHNMKAAGLHPIVGYEAFLTTGNRKERAGFSSRFEKPYSNLILLAKDLKGYYNLVYLASKAYTEGFSVKPRIDLEILSSHCEGLLAISPQTRGLIGDHLLKAELDQAKQQASYFQELFGKANFLLEVQDHNLDEEKQIRKHLVELSKQTEIPLVATNEAHYYTADDARAQELLYCISEGKTINDVTHTKLGSPTFYLRSIDEMWDIFRELPDALNKTLEVAEMCQLDLPKGEDDLQLPRFPIPPEIDCKSDDDYFEMVVMEGFEKRKKTVWDVWKAKDELKNSEEAYMERIRKELSLIKSMGFPGYFLIVWDFIVYAKKHGIPVGPGRGSAAGSLVAYCLEITDVDPLQYDLLFERFLNPERISMPDIDIDFCVRGRAEVINHVTEFYGRDSVCQIITFGTMASKAAIKDVGRALDIPFAEVEKVAKMIPPPVRGRNISISQAIEQVPELKKSIQSDPKVRELVDLALRLEGCARHSSVHAAGVVISPKPLHELVPVSLSSKNELTTQYPMADLEKTGMLKMDFLALTTLTVISDCLLHIKQLLGLELDWSTIPLNDEKAMALFGEGRTDAIFQFESSGMQEICRRLKPKELEDLAALNALYRPGPLDGGMVDDFISRHRGEKKVKYIVKEMEEILKNTFGIIVYQEQIMQLAQKLAGYSLGEADMMRRAMGKKKKDEMAKHSEKFVDGAIERGIDKEKAEQIFNLMAQFADYGFNRSHSVAYAYLAFQTAYLKAHYAPYFYASVLSHEAQDSAKVFKYSAELQASGLKLLPPDVNESGLGFTPIGNAVRFGLSAIKGIGANSIEAILKARNEKNFTSLFDFISRIEANSINRRVLESLITAGAFDSIKSASCPLELWRAKLFASVEIVLAYGQKFWNDKIMGQNDLFAMVTSDEESVPEIVLPKVPAWSLKELLSYEKAAIGFYLSNHPLGEYRDLLDELKVSDYTVESGDDNISVVGVISGLQIKNSKKGNKFAVFKLEDYENTYKCLAWSETFTKISSDLQDDQIVMVIGRLEKNDGQEMTIILDDLVRISEIVPNKSRCLLLTVPETVTQLDAEEILTVLTSNRGKCEVILESATLSMNYKLSTNNALRVKGSTYLENELAKRGCQVSWVI